jgi:hypothetical protein
MRYGRIIINDESKWAYIRMLLSRNLLWDFVSSFFYVSY